MATRTVEVVWTCAAPVTTVWELVSDVESWPEWGLFDEARLEQPGAEQPQGVGARRYVRADRMKNHEEVFLYEPPHRLAYSVLSGSLPVNDQRSEVRLEETAAGGTDIWWRTSYRPKLFGTGWMIDKNLKLFLTDAARRLAVRAETGAPAADD